MEFNKKKEIIWLILQKNGLGNPWTKTFKIVGVEKLVENGDLKELTLDYMKKYGWENVKGYSWTQKNMRKPPRELRY